MLNQSIDTPECEADDIGELRSDFAKGLITMKQLEDGLDDVFGVDGGSGHASWCYLFLPSGTCNCGGR